MAVLNRDSRQELLALLSALPDVPAFVGRTRRQLAEGWPALALRISSSPVPAEVLASLVAECDNYDLAPTQDHPLGLLLTTARCAALTSRRPAFDTLIARLPAWVVRVPPRRECPYPGMVPFQASDARFFYGREETISGLIGRLRAQHFLLLIGASGCGKSSLVAAGLVPTLTEQQPGVWYPIIMRPGSQPSAQLAAALGGDPHEPATVSALLAAHAPATRLLLVVDQLEEIFTLTRERAAQDAFFQALKAVQAGEAVRVLALVRADFSDELLLSALWRPPLGREEYDVLLPLAGEDLRQAIRKPAQAQGSAVEEGLVDALVRDAADEPGCLPLLQETLVHLWDAAGGCPLTLNDYARLGRGGRSGLATALSDKADATLSQLSKDNPAQRAIARRIFLSLIQFGEGRKDTRRQEQIATLRAREPDPALFDTTLATLTANRLLTTQGDPAQPSRLDLAHEQLISSWPTLQEWITAARGDVQTQRRWEAKATEWATHTSSLLDPVELPQAEEWIRCAAATELGVSAPLRALVKQSQRARTKRRAGAISLVITAVIMTVAAAIILSDQYRLKMYLPDQARGSTLLPLPTGTAVLPDGTTVPVKAFSLEPYEVTNLRYGFCVQAAVCGRPARQSSTYDQLASEAEKLPVAGVDAYQAYDFCHWLERRLPTAVEWRYAVSATGGNPNAPGSSSGNLHHSKPEPVGTYTPTPGGAYDLIGNVAEWTATLRPLEPSPLDSPWLGKWWKGEVITSTNSMIAVVGGSFDFDYDPNAPATFAPDRRDASIGFRCVQGGDP